jgi:DNA-binding XRE family transcriptional regulator
MRTEAEKLKAFRQERNLTQKQLADLLDYKQQSIAMIETYKRNMPDSLKLKILRYFGVDFYEI